MNKRKKMLSIVVVSSILLLFYVGFFKKESTDIFLQVQAMPEGELELCLVEQQSFGGLKTEFRADEYTIQKISMQEVESEEGINNYFFLPGYMDLSKVNVVFSGGESLDATLDGASIKTDEIYRAENLQEGMHTLTVGNQEIEFQMVKGSELPSVWIETESGMEHVYDSRDNSTPGVIRVFSASGQREYEGEFEILKGRGNSSWSQLKKSYSLKLKAQASLLGMTPGKSWVLQGGSLDRTCLRNQIFLDMAKECGLKNAVDSKLVDLYIDGKYHGCYALTEKIGIATGRLEIGDLEEKTLLLNEEPLVQYGRYRAGEVTKRKGYHIPNNPSDISGGYLLEMEIYKDRYDGESSGFITAQEYPIVIKSPTYASAAQVDYIAGFVQDFETALYGEDGYNDKGKSYLEYIDLESFVVRYLVDEVSKNIDAGASSYFFYKPQGEDKLYAGPVWDYDTALGNNNGWGNEEELQNPVGLYANRATWSEYLWAKEEFRVAAKEIFEERFMPYLTELTEEGMAEYIDAVDESVEMEAILYGRENPDAEFEKLKSFLEERTKFFEEAPNLFEVSTE